MPRPLSGAAISFGLVTIPVRLYSATRSLAPAFHLDPPRMRQPYPRAALLPQGRACRVARGARARLRDRQGPVRDLHARGAGSARGHRSAHHRHPGSSCPSGRSIRSTSRRPPTWDRTGAATSRYRLLAEVMRDRDEVALGTYVIRGKENLVAIRAYRGRARPPPRSISPTRCATSGRSTQGKGPVRREELKLALRLVEALRQASLRLRRPSRTPTAREWSRRRARRRAASLIRDERPAAPRGHRGGLDGCAAEEPGRHRQENREPAREPPEGLDGPQRLPSG